GGHRVLEGDVAEGLEGFAQRADGAGDQGAALSGLARELGPLAIDLAHLLLEAVGAELAAVRPEGGRLQEAGARGDVLLVDAAHEARVRDVELVEAAVEEDAARVQHRAHGAVGHDNALADALEEGLHKGRLSLDTHASSQSNASSRPGPDGSAPTGLPRS